MEWSGFNVIRGGCGILLSVLVCGLLVSAANQAVEEPIVGSEKQFNTPVLTGKTDNPVLRIHIKVPTQAGGQEATTFAFSTEGTTSLKDLKNIRLYYCGKDSLLERAVSKGTALLVGTAPTPARTIIIDEKQPLQPGDNYFWLACELQNDADVQHVVAVHCQKIMSGKGPIPLTSQPTRIKQRMGIALRKHMDDNVHTFRIPGLTTTKQGTLLAVYDARRESGRDLQGDIDIGVSRSSDRGKSWEPMRIALDKGTWGGLPQKFNGVSDACILVDQQSNTIYVAGLWMYGVKNEQGEWVEGLQASSTAWNHQWRNKGSQPGFDVKETAQFLLTKSTDDGKTWSEPVNLTRMIKQEDWWLLAPAPGHGITLADGTLVFPTQGRDQTGQAFSNITYSKDGGKTWKASKRAYTNVHTNENMAVELSDGSIMLNMRSGKNSTDTSNTNGRAIAITRDLGETWQVHPTSFGALPEPTCMASIHRHAYTVGGKKKSLLVFSNPNSKRGRDHLTLKVSFDDGLTWPRTHWILLDELKSRGYSCLTSVDEKTIGIVYESSQADLVFQKISLAELLK